MVSVLFVCLGNICRSPTAEAVFTERVESAGLSDRFVIDSAGTGGWHVGEAPDERAASAAARRGYDLGRLRARQVEPADFERFQFILAMDRENLAELEAMKPADFAGELRLFLEYARHSDIDEVPDPYFGGVGGFDHVLNLIEDAAGGLLRHIRESVWWR